MEAVEEQQEQEKVVVNVIDALGVVQSGFVMRDPKPDKKGLISLQLPNTEKVVRVHPSRIQNSESNPGSIAVQDCIAHDNSVLAACPTCHKVYSITDDATECPDHGPFDIVGKVDSKAPKTAPSKKKPELVDLDELASHGELWVKSGIKFDDKTDVKTLCLIVGTRFVTFNIYNSTYGKKGTRPPIEAMKNDEEVGYAIKDIDKLRKKLQKAGKNGKIYELWTTKTTK